MLTFSFPRLLQDIYLDEIVLDSLETACRISLQDLPSCTASFSALHTLTYARNCDSPVL